MKTKHYTSLPNQLIEDVKALGLSKTFTNSALHFISLLKSKSYKDYRLNDMPISLPYNYLSIIFTNNYKKNFLKALLDSNIIISNEYYSSDKSISICYNINSIYTYTNTSTSFITYMSPDFKEPLITSAFDHCKKAFQEDIDSLIINKESLLEIANKKINFLTIKNFNVNEQIEEQFIQLIEKKGNTVKKYWMTLEAAIVKAKVSGRLVIQDKTNFFLMDEKEFILNKKESILDSYNTSIHQLVSKYYFANRNITNNRLDTNITNMCSDLVDRICNDNNLVQIDLSNSQFAILSYIMSKDPNVNVKADFIRFKEVCESGELYTFLQRELSLESRPTAKKLMFHLAFAKRSNSPHYKKLQALFPTVTNWIAKYKKDNGSNTFAIDLQKEEAVIFIDNIWNSIKEQGFFCLTKHDSIIVKKENLDFALETIKEYFNSIKFKANIDILMSLDFKTKLLFEDDEELIVLREEQSKATDKDETQIYENLIQNKIDKLNKLKYEKETIQEDKYLYSS